MLKVYFGVYSALSIPMTHLVGAITEEAPVEKILNPSRFIYLLGEADSRDVDDMLADYCRAWIAPYLDEAGISTWLTTSIPK